MCRWKLQQLLHLGVKAGAVLYPVEELPFALQSNIQISTRRVISMSAHGANALYPLDPSHPMSFRFRLRFSL
jgi:hypothetical protein